ncbi:hypothetical protein CLOM_g9170 [Closterium sp. NIES-68]|nr:hypothetical protein CLOM_g9170 [Closterium sp. NIES-68]GJP77572.1 hypothetical protein CLOP_g7942 [Closterium sp. NIES-67]
MDGRGTHRIALLLEETRPTAAQFDGARWGVTARMKRAAGVVRWQCPLALAEAERNERFCFAPPGEDKMLHDHSIASRDQLPRQERNALVGWGGH